jgi:lipid-binding SYLF domain-containing protein
MDIQLHAEILAYSRTRGAFVGVSLDGTVVSEDGSEDRKLYRHEVNNKAILEGGVPVPDGGARLTARSVLADEVAVCWVVAQNRIFRASSTERGPPI